MTASITGYGSALPPAMGQQHLWEDFFKAHYADGRIAGTVWQRSGIQTRRGVVDPTREDISTWGTGARMHRFIAEALPLARDLGMTDSTQRLHIGHMGCYAALPGLGAVSDFTTARGRPSVLLCLELTSLHVQPSTDSARSPKPTKGDLEQMVAHALFSDAAAALVLEPAAGGLEVVDLIARTDVSTADHMTWDVTDLGFKMGLSPKVPDVLAMTAGPVVQDLLGRNGLTTGDVQGWAVHPGGRRIVEVVGEALALTDAQLAPSYDVLRDVGNCSSATVLLVLDRVLATTEIPVGGHVVAMAFGPGLTLCAALLTRR